MSVDVCDSNVLCALLYESMSCIDGYVCVQLCMAVLLYVSFYMIL